MRAPLRAVGVLLGVVAVLHGVVLLALPAPPDMEPLFGDERHYLRLAYEDVEQGTMLLLPGFVPYDTNLTTRAGQPLLHSRLVAQFVRASGSPRVERGPDDGGTAADEAWDAWDGGTEDPTTIVPRVAALHVLLLVATVAALAWAARSLGMGRAGTLVACGVLGAFPWYGAYVHTLWPEVLNGCLTVAGLACLLAHLRRGSLVLLALGGVALGLSMLAKASLHAFLPVAVVFTAAATAWRARGEVEPEGGWRGPHVGRGLLAALVLGGGVLVAVGPQLVANGRAGLGWTLSANRWWNLETGLRVAGPSDFPGERYFPDVYFASWRALVPAYEAPQSYPAREAAARERTLDYLASTPPWTVLRRQVDKLAWMLLRSESTAETALALGRWGEPPPGWLAALRVPARVVWYVLLVAGALGFAVSLRRSSGHALLALYTLYCALVIFLVPLKLRFVMPVVPALCLWAGMLVDRLAARRGAA